MHERLQTLWLNSLWKFQKTPAKIEIDEDSLDDFDKFLDEHIDQSEFENVDEDSSDAFNILLHENVEEIDQESESEHNSTKRRRISLNK